MAQTPAHLAPERCYVCGGVEHPETATHRFWSNADAEREIRAQLPVTAYDPASAYVSEYRPY